MSANTPTVVAGPMCGWEACCSVVLGMSSTMRVTVVVLPGVVSVVVVVVTVSVSVSVSKPNLLRLLMCS